MKNFWTWISIILAILGFIGIALFPPTFLFDELPAFLKKRSDQQSTSQEPSSTQPPRLRTRPSDGRSTPVRQPTVSQPWQQFISILKSHDSDIERSSAFSDLESRLPSRISASELNSVLKVFDSDIYRSSAFSDLESRLPSRISASELNSVLKVFDSDIYRSSAFSDLESRLPSRISLGELNSILESFRSEVYRSSADYDLKDRLTFD